MDLDNFNYEGSRGASLVHLTAYYGHADVVEILLVGAMFDW